MNISSKDLTLTLKMSIFCGIPKIDHGFLKLNAMRSWGEILGIYFAETRLGTWKINEHNTEEYFRATWRSPQDLGVHTLNAVG